MFLELMATFFVGFGVAGMILLANWLTGRRLPRALLPIGAGAGMIAFTIWSEYAWYDRTSTALPEGVVVTATDEGRIAWKPWTYVAPQISRFVAMDTASIRTHAEQPDQVMVNLLLMGRWAPGAEVPVIFDCAEHRRADLLDDVALSEDGSVEGALWRRVPSDDPSLTEACKWRG